MFETLLRRRLRPSASLTKSSNPPARVLLSEIAPAEFRWQSADGTRSWPICIDFKIMRTEPDGASEVELNIDHDGLRAQAVVCDTAHQTLVYLGNYFWVPDELKRNGLATGMVLALARAAQMAVPESVLDRRIVLEGYFSGEGARFAPAVCVGQPSKGQPSALRADVLERAHRRLTMSKSPEIVRRW